MQFLSDKNWAVDIIDLILSTINNYYRSVHTSPLINMPVSTYSAEERGQSNTDTYKVFIKDEQGEWVEVLEIVST